MKFLPNFFMDENPMNEIVYSPISYETFSGGGGGGGGGENISQGQNFHFAWIYNFHAWKFHMFMHGNFIFTCMEISYLHAWKCNFHAWNFHALIVSCMKHFVRVDPEKLPFPSELTDMGVVKCSTRYDRQVAPYGPPISDILLHSPGESRHVDHLVPDIKLIEKYIWQPRNLG